MLKRCQKHPESHFILVQEEMISHTTVCQLQELEKELFPEQKRALQTMSEHLVDWDNFYKDTFTLKALCTKGERFFTKESLNTANLPKGKSWQWNQSRSKKHLSVAGLDISFCKLNTRKAKGTTARSPAYKLWIFHLHFLTEDTWLHFAWCEKGDSPASTQITHQKQTCNSAFIFEPVESTLALNLNELSFLREFTDVFTAQQFGWCHY